MHPSPLNVVAVKFFFLVVAVAMVTGLSVVVGEKEERRRAEMVGLERVDCWVMNGSVSWLMGCWILGFLYLFCCSPVVELSPTTTGILELSCSRENKEINCMCVCV